jgi:hypothetical protein
VIVEFIDEHKEQFGVEPICRVLREHGLAIAPSSYRAARTRPPSARAQRDAVVLDRIRIVHGDRAIGRGVYGVRKVHAQLAREGGVDARPVSRRQVERLMRTDGLAGARRGRVFCTTRPDAAAPRPPDLVQRDFTASAPNRLWLVDFTYVRGVGDLDLCPNVQLRASEGIWMRTPIWEFNSPLGHHVEPHELCAREVSCSWCRHVDSMLEGPGSASW